MRRRASEFKSRLIVPIEVLALAFQPRSYVKLYPPPWGRSRRRRPIRSNQRPEGLRARRPVRSHVGAAKAESCEGLVGGSVEVGGRGFDVGDERARAAGEALRHEGGADRR